MENKQLTPKDLRGDLTQAAAAAKVGYSAEAWGKWERAGVLPDKVRAHVIAALSAAPDATTNATRLRKHFQAPIETCAECAGVSVSRWKRWEAGWPMTQKEENRTLKALSKATLWSVPAPKLSNAPNADPDPFGWYRIDHLRNKAKPRPEPKPEPQPEPEFQPMYSTDVKPVDIEFIQRLIAEGKLPGTLT